MTQTIWQRSFVIEQRPAVLFLLLIMATLRGALATSPVENGTDRADPVPDRTTETSPR